MKHLLKALKIIEQTLIWDYFKPRHTHAWNMLVLSWQQLDRSNDVADKGFMTEYLWENFIIRLWLYRTTVKTLEKLSAVEHEATNILNVFDAVFIVDAKNSLKAIRDMIEHFDDYAAGQGRGPGKRERDLDPWRIISQNRYQRGQFVLERTTSYEAAIQLREGASQVSDQFIQRYN
ncbi:hypothetical protein, partial [Ferrovibrio sp.]|uniref:hypothetical protein n=1 Tax=Ferrovibrio sp. TaxID=1917215 RepID=UPI0025C50E4B